MRYLKSISKGIYLYWLVVLTMFIISMSLGAQSSSLLGWNFTGRADAATPESATFQHDAVETSDLSIGDGLEVVTLANAYMAKDWVVSSADRVLD